MRYISDGYSEGYSGIVPGYDASSAHHAGYCGYLSNQEQQRKQREAWNAAPPAAGGPDDSFEILLGLGGIAAAGFGAIFLWTNFPDDVILVALSIIAAIALFKPARLVGMKSHPIVAGALLSAMILAAAFYCDYWLRTTGVAEGTISKPVISFIEVNPMASMLLGGLIVGLAGLLNCVASDDPSAVELGAMYVGGGFAAIATVYFLYRFRDNVTVCVFAAACTYSAYKLAPGILRFSTVNEDGGLVSAKVVGCIGGLIAFYTTSQIAQHFYSFANGTEGVLVSGIWRNPLPTVLFVSAAAMALIHLLLALHLANAGARWGFERLEPVFARFGLTSKRRFVSLLVK